MTSEAGNAAQASKVEAVAELVKRLCRALTNVEMFTADHPVSKHGIDLAYQYLREILDRFHEDVVISVAGNAIVLDGLPLEERNPLVSKLARRFDDVHINNIFFQPAVTSQEFQELFRILGKGPKTIHAEGGFPDLLKKSSIQHIHLKDVSYIMVTGDEKVVSKDARVVQGDSVAGVSMDSDIVKYMLGKVLEKADEQKWLINEIKNNPGRMAEMIAGGIDLAMSRAEMGHDTEGEIGTLINNIRIVGQQLIEEGGATAGGESEEADVEKALVTLEKELRLRSSKLMSSKVAAGFVNEILGVVSSYSDQVRTKQISDEFLKGEKSLRKTEQLLRKMAPDRNPEEKSVVVKVADEIVKRGMSEEEMSRVLDEIKPAQKPEAAVKDERKPVGQLLSSGIEKRLQAAGLEGDHLKNTMNGITPYIEAMVRDKAGEFQKEAEALRADIGFNEQILKEISTGILTWDPEGKVRFINQAARKVLGNELGIECSPALARRLKEWTFPMEDVPDLMKETDLTNNDVSLLLNISKVMKDEQGRVCGVILLSSRAGR